MFSHPCPFLPPLRGGSLEKRGKKRKSQKGVKKKFL
nr:MAG TPA_asm: 5-aminolevulinate synthase [Caudoviricetes sp.]